MSNDKSMSAPAESAADIPVIEGFELLERCGCGGESSVWKARQLSLGRIVVVKILAENLARDPDDVKQFQFEAKVAANLKHRGIVQVYDFGMARPNGPHYFVMEYVEGRSVGEYVRRKGRLSESDCLVIAHGVAEALKYAWDHARIIHCDVKPDNIMVDGDGAIKITDLGLARVVRSFGSKTAEEDIRITGTPNYMSPEQAMGQKHLDCRSDIYSLGASLYHMLTGVLPFAGSDVEETMRRQINEELEQPAKLVSGVSKDISDMVEKMMKKNPAFRFQSWSDVLDEIARIQRSARSTESKEAISNRIALSSRSVDVAETDCSVAVVCSHCGKQVKKGMSVCPFCSKKIETGDHSNKRKLKLKAASGCSQQQETIARNGSVPSAQARRRTQRHRSKFMENVRMTVSLALLCFLGYYGYQRVVKQRDILLPCRVYFYRHILPAGREAVQRLGHYASDVLPFNINSGGLRPGDESLEADESEFLAVLRECEAETPKVGDHIDIKLKGREISVKGTIERIGPSGVIIGMEKGTIACPYLVMEDQLRLLFSPEERARLIMKERKAALQPTPQQ